MNINDELLKEIRENNDLSLDLAKRLKISQGAILKQVERRSKLLLLPAYLEVYKEYGFTDEQIFDYQADESRNSLQCHSGTE